MVYSMSDAHDTPSITQQPSTSQQKVTYPIYADRKYPHAPCAKWRVDLYAMLCASLHVSQQWIMMMS